MASRHLTFHFPGRTVILVIGEVGLLLSSFLAATILHFGRNSFLILSLQNGIAKIVVVAVLGLLCMYFLDLYDFTRLRSPQSSYLQVLKVVGILSLLLGLLGMVFPNLMMGGYVFLTGLPILAALVLLWRKVFLAMSRSKRLVQRTLIVGDGDYTTSLWNEIEKRPDLGLELVGYVSQSDHPTVNEHIPRLGNMGDLETIIRSERIHRIVVTMRDRRGKLPVETLLGLKWRGVQIEDAADFYESVTGRVPLESLRISWLLFSRGFCPSRIVLILSRIVTSFLAAFLFVLMLPLMAFIGLAIWLDTGSPILFRQKRVGKRGKVFDLYKFRTMTVLQSGVARPTQEEDARVTRIGRFLRKARIDELPQLFNILRGDMAFVGPRPFMVEEEFDLARQIPHYAQRWSVSPGATGWAQIQRPYCVTLKDNEDKLSYDLFYIKNMSIVLDFLILLQTVKVLLLGRGSR